MLPALAGTLVGGGAIAGARRGSRGERCACVLVQAYVVYVGMDPNQFRLVRVRARY